MWARVKGKTENDLMKLPFKGAYMFRPSYIQPMNGIRSKTALYQSIYVVFGALYPLLKYIAPKSITTTENVGRAMIRVVKVGSPKHILEASDINELGTAVDKPTAEKEIKK